jgi:hypothetical protein
MESEDIRELRATLAKLKQEHRDLDSAINALELSGRADPLQLKRLKKKKLFLKDEIARIEDQLLPDIIALGFRLAKRPRLPIIARFRERPPPPLPKSTR